MRIVIEQRSLEELDALLDKLEEAGEAKTVLEVGALMRAIDDEDATEDEVDRFLAIIMKGLAPDNTYSMLFRHVCATFFRKYVYVDDEFMKAHYKKEIKNRKGMSEFVAHIQSHVKPSIKVKKGKK